MQPLGMELEFSIMVCDKIYLIGLTYIYINSYKILLHLTLGQNSYKPMPLVDISENY